MVILQNFIRSSVGKKVLVALSGAFLALFLIVHMTGNLQLFLGPDSINQYAASLKKFPMILWGARLGLIFLFLLHITLTFHLTIKNRAARPIGYYKNNSVRASMPSRTLIISGLLILIFLIYHLLHFTVGALHSEYFGIEDHLGRSDIYYMVVRSFREYSVVLIYSVAMLILAFHLIHATQSMFQTLGQVKAGSYIFLKNMGIGITFLIVAGFLAVPVAIAFGLIRLPGE